MITGLGKHLTHDYSGKRKLGVKPDIKVKQDKDLQWEINQFKMNCACLKTKEVLSTEKNAAAINLGSKLLRLKTTGFVKGRVQADELNLES